MSSDIDKVCVHYDDEDVHCYQVKMTRTGDLKAKHIPTKQTQPETNTEHKAQVAKANTKIHGQSQAQAQAQVQSSQTQSDKNASAKTKTNTNVKTNANVKANSNVIADSNVKTNANKSNISGFDKIIKNTTNAASRIKVPSSYDLWKQEARVRSSDTGITSILDAVDNVVAEKTLLMKVKGAKVFTWDDIMKSLKALVKRYGLTPVQDADDNYQKVVMVISEYLDTFKVTEDKKYDDMFKKYRDTEYTVKKKDVIDMTNLIQFSERNTALKAFTVDALKSNTMLRDQPMIETYEKIQKELKVNITRVDTYVGKGDKYRYALGVLLNLYKEIEMRKLSPMSTYNAQIRIDKPSKSQDVATALKPEPPSAPFENVNVQLQKLVDEFKYEPGKIDAVLQQIRTALPDADYQDVVNNIERLIKNFVPTDKRGLTGVLSTIMTRQPNAVQAQIATLVAYINKMLTVTSSQYFTRTRSLVGFSGHQSNVEYTYKLALQFLVDLHQYRTVIQKGGGIKSLPVATKERVTVQGKQRIVLSTTLNC